MFLFKRKKSNSSESCGCATPQIEKSKTVSKESCCIFNLDDEIRKAQAKCDSSEGERNE